RQWMNKFYASSHVTYTLERRESIEGRIGDKIRQEFGSVEAFLKSLNLDLLLTESNRAKMTDLKPTLEESHQLGTRNGLYIVDVEGRVWVLMYKEIKAI